MYVGFIDLEKAYDRVNRKELWQVLRMCDVGGKLLNGIKSIYVNSLACVRVKGGENEFFRINSGVKQRGIMSPQFFNVYMDGMMMEKKGFKFQEVGREWRLSGFLYADDLVLCDELEEDLRAMVERFVEVFKRRGLKAIQVRVR